MVVMAMMAVVHATVLLSICTSKLIAEVAVMHWVVMMLSVLGISKHVCRLLIHSGMFIRVTD